MSNSQLGTMIADRSLTDDEVVRILRENIAAENLAANNYEQLAQMVQDPRLKGLLQDLANEEVVHAGELLRAIAALRASEQDHIRSGFAEADKKLSVEVSAE